MPTRQHLLETHRYHEAICDDSVLRDAAYRTSYTPCEIGIRLNLERYEIDNCIVPHESLYEQRYQVLYLWKKKNGAKATYQQLLDSLSSCLPPDKQYYDYLIDIILKKLTCSTVSTVATETQVVRDAPIFRSLTDSDIQVNIDRKSAEIANNLLGISLDACSSLTATQIQYVEENRRLRRANSLLTTRNKVMEAELLRERTRRTIVEGKIASIEEDRNKYMFENVLLHSQIGQLQQGKSVTVNGTYTIDISSTTHPQQVEDHHSCATNCSNNGLPPVSIEEQCFNDSLLNQSSFTLDQDIDPTSPNDKQLINDLTTQPSLSSLHHESNSAFSKHDESSTRQNFRDQITFRISPEKEDSGVSAVPDTEESIHDVTSQYGNSNSYGYSEPTDHTFVDHSPPLLIDETTQLEWAM